MKQILHIILLTNFAALGCGLASLVVNLALSMIHLYGGMSADQRRRVDSERVLDLDFKSRPVRWNVRWSGSKGGPWQYHRLIDKVELVIRLRHARLYVSWSTTRVDPRQRHKGGVGWDLFGGTSGWLERYQVEGQPRQAARCPTQPARRTLHHELTYFPQRTTRCGLILAQGWFVWNEPISDTDSVC